MVVILDSVNHYYMISRIRWNEEHEFTNATLCSVKCEPFEFCFFTDDFRN